LVPEIINDNRTIKNILIIINQKYITEVSKVAQKEKTLRMLRTAAENTAAQSTLLRKCQWHFETRVAQFIMNILEIVIII
jgi:hypothetical protein